MEFFSKGFCFASRVGKRNRAGPLGKNFLHCPLTWHNPAGWPGCSSPDCPWLTTISWLPLFGFWAAPPVPLHPGPVFRDWLESTLCSVCPSRSPSWASRHFQSVVFTYHFPVKSWPLTPRLEESLGKSKRFGMKRIYRQVLLPGSMVLKQWLNLSKFSFLNRKCKAAPARLGCYTVKAAWV
jgi:hypothetical protein